MTVDRRETMLKNLFELVFTLARRVIEPGTWICKLVDYVGRHFKTIVMYTRILICGLDISYNCVRNLIRGLCSAVDLI